MGDVYVLSYLYDALPNTEPSARENLSILFFWNKVIAK